MNRQVGQRKVRLNEPKTKLQSSKSIALPSFLEEDRATMFLNTILVVLQM
jgi:hypothetical protein